MAKICKDQNLTGSLLLVRHVQSRATANWMIGGPKGCPGLTGLSRHQTETLRATRIAEVTLEADCDAVIVHDDLKGLRLGGAGGLSWDVARERFESTMSGVNPQAPVMTGGESRTGFRARTVKALEEIVRCNRNAAVLVTCRTGVITATIAATDGVASRTTDRAASRTTDRAASRTNRWSNRRLRATNGVDICDDHLHNADQHALPQRQHVPEAATTTPPTTGNTGNVCATTTRLA